MSRTEFSWAFLVACAVAGGLWLLAKLDDWRDRRSYRSYRRRIEEGRK